MGMGMGTGFQCGFGETWERRGLGGGERMLVEEWMRRGSRCHFIQWATRLVRRRQRWIWPQRYHSQGDILMLL